MDSVRQNLCYDEDTALSLAKPNCKKCYGRGSHIFDETRGPGQFLRKIIYCDCVVKELKKKASLQ